MIVNPNIWGALRDKADNNVWDLVSSGAPTSGTSGTGLNLAGPGSTYTDIATGIIYRNINTAASPTWDAMLGSATISPTILVLPGATTPAQTAEGSVVWDTDSDLLTVGDGSSRKTMVDLTTSQVMTNKTLTAPAISAPVITGAMTVAAGATFTNPTILLPVQSLAAAGNSQGTAGVITAVAPGIVLVSAADDTKGVVLPTAVAGSIYIIKSSTLAKILKVYPASGGTINTLAQDAAISLASGALTALFYATSATQWYTLPLLPS